MPATPTAPTPAPKPAATPSPAPAAKPSTPTAPKPAAAAPKPPTPTTAKPVEPPRNDRGQFVPGGPRSKAAPMSARKALGLPEDPSKTVAKIVEGARKNLKGQTAAPRSAPEVTPPAAPVVEAPAAPDPDPAPTPTPDPAPAAPVKIKVGDKEYSQEELVARMAELEKAATPAPAPAPAAPSEPAAPAPAPKELTAEEIKAAEDKWIADASANFTPSITEAELDTILAGGKDAVTALATIRSRDIATALLAARKDISGIINPHLERLDSQLQPLLEQSIQLQRYTATQEFVREYPDFAPHTDLAVSIAEQLIEKHPKEFGAMTDAQRRAEVARQTDVFLTNNYKRLFPGATGTWRDAAKAAAAPAPAPVPAPAPAAPTPPKPKPLASNPPASQSGAAAPSFQAATARTLAKL